MQEHTFDFSASSRRQDVALLFLLLMYSGPSRPKPETTLNIRVVGESTEIIAKIRPKDFLTQ
jgi:hypothetical protein